MIGAADEFQFDKQGVYKITNETKNGKPTWRNERGLFIFYNGKFTGFSNQSLKGLKGKHSN